MAIEVNVADHLTKSQLPGELTGTVVVLFDDASETMQIRTAFPDRGNSATNKAEAIRAAQQLARRFAELRAGFLE